MYHNVQRLGKKKPDTLHIPSLYRNMIVRLGRIGRLQQPSGGKTLGITPLALMPEIYKRRISLSYQSLGNYEIKMKGLSFLDPVEFTSLGAGWLLAKLVTHKPCVKYYMMTLPSSGEQLRFTPFPTQASFRAHFDRNEIVKPFLNWLARLLEL